MHIIFNPSSNPENHYITILVDALRENDFQVHELDGIFSSWRHFRSIRLVHLNWFENIDDTSIMKAFKSVIRKTLVLSIIHLSGKKLVWTMHNRVSHEKKTGSLSRFFTNLLIKWTDAIIIHSEISRGLLANAHPSVTDKIHYLPHPDFAGSYGPTRDVVPSLGTLSPLKLLFVGAVKPYKNIELLLEVMGKFGAEVELTIAGKPKNRAYAERLSKMAQGKSNIHLRLEFIPDGLLPELIGKADLLILPYDLQSSLNSGTVILAFSYKKTVICPEIGTLVDMTSVNNQFFGYSYQSETEHIQKITNAVHQAIQLKRTQPGALDRMGANMYTYITHHHQKEKVGQQLANIYGKLLQEER